VSIRDLPRPKLDYLMRLTDATGVIHGAYFDIPDRSSGYSTDDNAMALAAAVLCRLQTDDPRALELARACTGFLRFMQLPDGRFHNFLSYDHSFADEVGSEDCQGRAISSLGLTVALEQSEGIAFSAKAMFDDALDGLELSYPRAMAYAVCGCYHYLTRFPGASHVSAFLEKAAASLMTDYERASSPDWRWFEDTLYYANGLLPRALLLSYRALKEERYREVGLESLQFLTDTCYSDGVFDLIGDQGWYPKGGERARFEQLPIEAASLAEAYIDAYVIERDEHHLELARAAFEWFLGRNVLEAPLYDFAPGSCADGILAHGVDQNRSAAATVHYLLALLRMATALHLEQSDPGKALTVNQE
jgi:hypothetical protein